MSVVRRAVFVVVLVLASLAGGALAQSSSVEVTGTRPACVSARAEARMQAYGFDHFVAARNGCDQPVECSVTTSVNPSPTVLELAPGQSRETLMWRGSPASTFVANVDCTMR